MQQEYEFVIPPLFEGIDQLQEKYESSFKGIASSCRESYLDLLKSSSPEKAYETLSGKAFADLANLF